ncbi:hypothetical protein LTH96_06275 [Nesterenkonia sp. LB17]|uniref:hypothetical protein n=1 Tax=unclassified Nesterenkonia TaxID=2629769 RepID=UPI001F4C9C52|nr:MULTISPECIES: hypothetical protein [unclassified Nesterenkonia]MCH8561297.1 hypothetical protein [Nesterenkonia sp. DZ6]MCH8562389.1 hypothetical protein [Nesterenkonia sp. YGD6]MCH8565325.1 hypothetical protein [Nesterenkonia sp. LB17]MCH8571243.1 hypothetical protein [Nesterenkonia sp. AY15]
MITLYRRDEQAWNYREAWYDEATGEFVIHHGVLGANGKLSSEGASAEEAEQLLESFTAQCRADGFTEPPAEAQIEMRLLYPLKGAQPSASEERNIGAVHREVLATLAWRGLGLLSDPVTEPHAGGHASVMRIKTLHQGKAKEAVKAAMRAGDVPASKIELRVG